MSSDKQAVYEQLLATRCQRGDSAALEELIERWEGRLFYYVRRLVDQEADAWDVLQKTWIKVMRRIKTLRDPRSLPCWLYTLARNTAIDHRRARPEIRLPLSDADENERLQDEADHTAVLESAEAVHEALDRLSPPHREVLTLFFLQDLTIEEIAQVIGAKVGTVKSRLHYARGALRKALQDEGRP